MPIITPLVTRRAGQLGDYRVDFILSAANGFELNKSYNVVVQATVAGITAKARIYAFNIEPPTGSVNFVV